MEESIMSDRLRMVDDRLAIIELVAQYAFAIDRGDFSCLVSSFLTDGRFYSEDGQFSAQGHILLRRLWETELAKITFSRHIVNHQSIVLDQDDRDRASGTVAGHAESVRNGKADIFAMNYHDHYQRNAGRWVFSERKIQFLYYTTSEDYCKTLPELYPLTGFVK